MIAHGGAWYWDDTLDAAKHLGLEAAVNTGHRILAAGGSALDVRVLHGDPASRGKRGLLSDHGGPGVASAPDAPHHAGGREAQPEWDRAPGSAPDR